VRFYNILKKGGIMNKKLTMLFTITLIYSVGIMGVPVATYNLKVTNYTGEKVDITIEQPEERSKSTDFFGTTETIYEARKKSFHNVPSGLTGEKAKKATKLKKRRAERGATRTWKKIMFSEAGGIRITQDVQVTWKYNDQTRKTRLIKTKGAQLVHEYPFHIYLYKDSYDIHWKPQWKKAEYGLKAEK